MPRRGSRESFELNYSPRLGRSGFESKLKPYLQDIILLVLQHFTASQIHEWIAEHKRVAIGRHAVGRFVKRIQTAVETIDQQPATRADSVLRDAIHKAVTSRHGTALQLVNPTRSTVETPGTKEARVATAPNGVADKRVSRLMPEALISSQEIQSVPSSGLVKAPKAVVETRRDSGEPDVGVSRAELPSSQPVHLPPLSVRRRAVNAEEMKNNPLADLARDDAARKRGEHSKTLRE
ncbi:MAG: hypothetical protein P4L57_14445 [Rhizomicrobium sp.]|nr:hypothetical protein [Rhizomicrobium sp.]